MRGYFGSGFTTTELIRIKLIFISLSTYVLFSQTIVERANENNKPRDMTASTKDLGGG